MAADGALRSESLAEKTKNIVKDWYMAEKSIYFIGKIEYNNDSTDVVPERMKGD